MEAQHAKAVHVISHYEDDGQVIVQLKTKTNLLPPLQGKRRQRSIYSRKMSKGVNNSTNTKRSKYAWSQQQHAN